MEIHSCPVCGAILPKPEHPCSECEAEKVARARALEEMYAQASLPLNESVAPDNPPHMETYIEPPREDSHQELSREDDQYQSLDELYNIAWSKYGLPVANWENQVGKEEAINHKVELVSIELEQRKTKAKKKGDYPELIKLKFEHYYLDKRLIDWENDGPDPFNDFPGTGWYSLDELIENLLPIFAFIGFWWNREPFLIHIIERRIEQRMEQLISDSIEIPKNQRTVRAYHNLINDNFKHITQLFEEGLFGRDLTNGLLANVQWGQIYLSEIGQLLNEDELFKKLGVVDGYFKTIMEAPCRSISYMFKLIAWDRAWLSCPWIINYACDNDFSQELAVACKGKSGCLRKKDQKELITGKKDAQFLYDRFFCGQDVGDFKTPINEFLDKAESFPADYEGSYRDPWEFRKFLIRNLRL
jgi:hypothetical protein